MVTASANDTSIRSLPIDFKANDLSAIITQLSSTRKTMTADGRDTVILTGKVQDQQGNPLKDIEVTLSNNNYATITPEKSETDNDGTFTAELATTYTGHIEVTAKLHNGAEKTVSILAKADKKSPHVSKIESDKTSFTAGDNVTYSATVINAQGQTLPKTKVTWQLTRGTAEHFDPISRTNDKGIATITVKSRTAGRLLMTAYLDEKNKATANEVTVNPASVNTSASTFITDKNSISSDGQDAETLTVTLKDLYGNAIPEKNIHISTQLKGFNVSWITDNKDVSYQAKVTSTAKGHITLNASVGHKQIGTRISIKTIGITPTCCIL